MIMNKTKSPLKSRDALEIEKQLTSEPHERLDEMESAGASSVAAE